jgi:NADP-dependent 3-hydroxy acid dehydrogenase YdfG
MPASPRTWFITGASSGFGRAVGVAAAGRGDNVVATAGHPETLRDLVERFAGRITAAQVDVTDATSVQEAVDATIERRGRIDVVVNDAGYAVLGAYAVDELRAEYRAGLAEIDTVEALARGADFPTVMTAAGR